MDEPYINEGRISFADLVNGLVRFVNVILSKWRRLLILFAGISLLFFGYFLIKKTSYTAETTFVIDAEGNPGGGDISSLASIVGINLSSIGNTSSLFQTDNIMELYKSRRMLTETFITEVDVKGNSERLITRWAKHHRKIKSWKKKLNDPDFSFEIPLSEFSQVHDSVLFEVIDGFQEDNLTVRKPDRKKSVLSVRINSTDQLFAMHFNKELVRNVNDFYLKTKTKKSLENLKTLQRQADSVREVLDASIAELSLAMQRVPNPNPIILESMVPLQKLRIDVESNSVIYAEIVKNLEVAKISHRNNIPLIQVIDEPILPLVNDRYSLLKSIVISVFLGGFIVLIGFTIQYFVSDALKRS